MSSRRAPTRLSPLQGGRSRRRRFARADVLVAVALGAIVVASALVWLLD